MERCLKYRSIIRRPDWAESAKYYVAKINASPIPNGEPLFVLRAQNCLAHVLVRQYADEDGGVTEEKINECWPMQRL